MSGTRSIHGSVVTIASAANLPYGDDYTAWSGLAKCPNGDLLYMTCAGASEITVVRGECHNDFFRSTDGGATWSLETRVGYRAGIEEGWLGTFTDSAGVYMLVAGNLNVGYTYPEAVDPLWYQQSYTSRSTDNGHTWDAAAMTYFYRSDGSLWRILKRDGNYPNGDLAPQDLEMTGGWVQLPDESLIAPLGVVPQGDTGGGVGGGIETGSRASGWTALVRSTDRGVTWQEYGTPPFPFQQDWQFLEPSLIWLPSGRLACIARTKEFPLTTYDDYTSWINYSNDGGLTWTGAHRMFRRVASRDMAVVGPEGDIIMGVRSVLASQVSGPTVWMQSWDEGLTWTSPIQMPVTLGVSAYGQAVNLLDDAGVDGNIGIMYQEASQFGVTANAYFVKFTAPTGWSGAALGSGTTVSAGYGEVDVQGVQASLTIDPASTAFEQIDTQIIVRVLADAPTETAVTFSSPGGGLVRFRGTDAANFTVSLDGTTWSSTLDIPAGDTNGYLRVTPDAPDTTLTAEIGVPI